MICAKHKETYDGKCPKCSAESLKKEQNLEATLGTQRYKTTKWNSNPVYDGGREYTPTFRSKVYSAQVFLTKEYGALLDNRKMGALDNALRNNLDDVFAVSSDDQKWTNVVHALGGKHNDPVYNSDGKLLGVMQSFGCTTYERVEVNSSNSHASKDPLTTMMAIFDDSKRIYLHGSDVHVSTVTHEMLHYFCHKNFYKAFAEPGVGAEWKALNEGVTEYLTREAYKGDSRGAYQEEYGKVQLLLKAGLVKKEIEEAYFLGNIGALVDKMKAGEIGAENVILDSRSAAVFAGVRRGKKTNTAGDQNVTS